MKRLTVAVLAFLVLLTATVVLAEEVQAPPTVDELMQNIQGLTKQIEGFERKIAELKEVRTRMHGAYQLALAIAKYEALQDLMTCEDSEAGECSAKTTDP